MSQDSFPSHSDAHSHHHHYHLHAGSMSPSCHPQSYNPNANLSPRYESPIPFETALDRLYATLSDSVAFFKFLGRSFDEETRFIRWYASEGVLGVLWSEKVALSGSLPGSEGVMCASGSGRQSQSESSGSSHGCGHSHHSRRRAGSGLCGGGTWRKREGGREKSRRDAAPPPPPPLPSVNKTLHDHLQTIDHALLDAIYCRWPSEPAPPGPGPSQSPPASLSCLDVDGLSRLREKLWMQDQALRGITTSQPGSVFREPECLGEVVKECELLVFYLGRVRALWR